MPPTSDNYPRNDLLLRAARAKTTAPTPLCPRRQAHWCRLATPDLAIGAPHGGDTAYKAPGQTHCR